MQDWANHLQHFLTSVTRDRCLLKHAAEACKNPEIKSFLTELPTDKPEVLNTGSLLVHQMKHEGFIAEAAVLELAIFLPQLEHAAAGDVGGIPPEKRQFYDLFFESLRQNCRKEVATRTSLAFVSNRIGRFRHQLGKLSSARRDYEEARDVLHALAQTAPQGHEGLLADTLRTLGIVCNELGDFTAARQAYEEARVVLLNLVKTDPQAYETALLFTLNNLGVLHRHTRNFTDAIGIFGEALGILSKDAGGDEAEKDNHLAGTLNNLGILYFDLGHFNEARKAFEDALTLRRRLAEGGLLAQKDDLVRTLNSLGALCKESGDHEAARKAFEGALVIYSKLAEDDPDIYEVDLAGTLSNLGDLLCKDEKSYGPARKAFEKALEIYSKLANEEPEANRDNIAQTLNSLGNIHNNVKEFGEARQAYEKAIVHSEQVTPDHVRYLSKGKVRDAYRYLIGDSVNDSVAAFVYAAAIRDGPTRSSELGHNDLNATQEILRELEKRVHRPVAILTPTVGHDSTITLGLITATVCRWWRLSSAGWADLLPKRSEGADQLARYHLARQIWRELPQVVQKALNPFRSKSFEVLISGDSFWSVFPWELLRFGDGTDDFLGLHRALPRIGSILAPALEKDFAKGALGQGHRVAIIAPHTTLALLSGVETEVETISSRLTKIGGELFETSVLGQHAHDGLMRRSLHAAPDVLWYTGHGAFSNNEEFLILHAENRPPGDLVKFGAYQLNEIAEKKETQPLLGNAPLVVLNSCMSGFPREHGGHREDLVAAFLKHGAGAVLATAMPISDTVGEALGQAIFSDVTIAKPTIGASVIEARKQLAAGLCQDLRRPTWGAWGMVHLYGNSLAVGPFNGFEGIDDEQTRD